MLNGNTGDILSGAGLLSNGGSALNGNTGQTGGGAGVGVPDPRQLPGNGNNSGFQNGIPNKDPQTQAPPVNLDNCPPGTMPVGSPTQPKSVGPDGFPSLGPAKTLLGNRTQQTHMGTGGINIQGFVTTLNKYPTGATVGFDTAGSVVSFSQGGNSVTVGSGNVIFQGQNGLGVAYSEDGTQVRQVSIGAAFNAGLTGSDRKNVTTSPTGASIVSQVGSGDSPMFSGPNSFVTMYDNGITASFQGRINDDGNGPSSFASVTYTYADGSAVSFSNTGPQGEPNVVKLVTPMPQNLAPQDVTTIYDLPVGQGPAFSFTSENAAFPLNGFMAPGSAVSASLGIGGTGASYTYGDDGAYAHSFSFEGNSTTVENSVFYLPDGTLILNKSVAFSGSNSGTPDALALNQLIFPNSPQSNNNSANQQQQTSTNVQNQSQSTQNANGSTTFTNGSGKTSTFTRIPPPPPNTDPCPPIASGQGEARGPGDPNSLTGPAGFGPQQFVAVGQTLGYTIDFANEATATAPAQTVTVTEQLDPNLDFSTFQLTSLGFGSIVVPVPAGRTSFETRVDARSTVGVFVDVNLNFNVVTGQLTATFTTIDPATLDQPKGDSLEGFLPPDNASGIGEGFVNYRVLPRATDVTGTLVNAQVSIVFDTNAAIATNVFTNTIDAGRPTSTVQPLPATTTSTTFTVSWAGSDDAGGSGLATFDICVSDHGGPFLPMLLATTQTSVQFTGAVGHTYGFYSVDLDNVSQHELSKGVIEAFVSIEAPSASEAPPTSAPTTGLAAPQIILVSGAGAGGSPQVAVQFGDGTSVSFFAWQQTFAGGVRVPQADVTGDGFPDVIVAAGPGGGAEFKVYDGQLLHDGKPALIADVFAWPLGSLSGGITVAAGDVNHDGHADVVVGAGAGGLAEVKVYDGAALAKGQAVLIADFFAWPNFNGGVTVAAGDTNGDGFADVVVGAGPGGMPEVKVFDGKSLSMQNTQLLDDFFAFLTSFRGGVNVAAGDLDGTGLAEVVVGAGPGGGPEFEVYGNGLAQGVASGAQFAYPDFFHGGVAVSVGAYAKNGTVHRAIFTGAGPGGSPQEDVFDAQTSQLLDEFFTGPQTFGGGVFPAGSGL